ncbi:pleckstrin homology domain-containing family A member 7-like isoform X12 [Denticeps clupeoides]|uniref:pleckstrin homology domain-containing family A member 7-like isoform X12 n=1 Tax=Denticeps clupeoides TaxID=299321 RepID=UPI0010A399CE|nr:pleckstrin homology domain-containing family A member 7-like isoform X12 [Denticeps clupeoides]
MAAPLGRDTLPDHWSYGVCRDGRVFFINDKTRGTTWLHPRTGEPVNSGHMIRSDLPRGWEEGFTDEGASYFINHNQRTTAFRHPVTGQISSENSDFFLQEQINSRMSKPPPEHWSPGMVSKPSTGMTSSTVDVTSGSKGSRAIGKVHSFGKREQAIKRNPNMPVVVRGWLYKQDSSGMRLWKRKWFVLSDYCLFYYKDSREETVLGSIPLPSYVITPVDPDDHISRKYAFKATHTGMRSYIYNKNSVIGSQAEHGGMRTYYFSADTQEDMNGWIKAMNQAALMQSHGVTSHPSSEYTLPRRTPPLQPKAVLVEAYQSLPKTIWHPSLGGSPPIPRNLPSDYKYAQDRLSHFRMSTDERLANREGMVWQLYEWQQRQQFRHGSPTAPIYSGPDYVDASAFRMALEVPRSISVPPSPCDIPPPGPPSKSLSPRRPHTPADRVTVRPLDEVPPSELPMACSPRRACPQISKTAQIERRSMPNMGYITHTVSAPSLHGKTPEELTLLLVQLRRHQAQMASVRNDTFAHLQQQSNGLSGYSLQADDTYLQLKKDLEYLDLKINSIEPAIAFIRKVLQNSSRGYRSGLKVTGRDTLKKARALRPVKIAESDVDVKLSRLCEQDKILQDLETRICTLKEDKDKLESVLDVSHQQMEQYRDQPAHAEKIAYQQRLLQEDVVHIRAEISQVSTEMEHAWSDYSQLEQDVVRLRSALQEQMNRSVLSLQEKAQLRKELWRIEDVMAGLSSSKANYKITIDSVLNPGEREPVSALTRMHWSTNRERKLVPSVSLSSVPSISASPPGGELKPLQHSTHLSPVQPTQQPLQQLPASLHNAKWAEEGAPPRPPLPHLYSPDEHPPAVPPLPKETSVIRHTSVRGLKRQSDERKRDREIGQYTNGDKVELRAFLSEPELLGVAAVHGGGVVVASGYQTLPSRGISGSSSRPNQSTSISSYVTVRRGASAPALKERPRSAVERLYAADPGHQRSGRMSADEQLERMKRHQKALVRQRKRTLSQGERHVPTASHSPSSSAPRPVSADLGSWKREQEFDLQLLERAVQGEERPVEHLERPRSQSDEWLTLRSMTELDLEPLDYHIDLSRELSKPKKVEIPERYMDLEPEEPLSPQEMEARHRKVERIKSILAKSSVQNIPPPVVMDKPEMTDLDSALQEQERIITMSYALASEASIKSKQVAVPSPPQANDPTSPPPPPPPPPLPPPSASQAPPSPVSNGFHYTFV